MFYFQLIISLYSVCYTKSIVVMLRERYFLNNLIVKVGGVNQHEPGESYSKFCFFFRFNGSHTCFSLEVKMMPLVKYFLCLYPFK